MSKDSIIKIALLQLLPEGGLDRQLEKGKAACVKAKDMGADFDVKRRRGHFSAQRLPYGDKSAVGSSYESL